MPARILLIDGYNLLHAAGMGPRDDKPGELLRCRTRLLGLIVQKLSHAELRSATLVFDARDPPPDRPSEVVVSGLRVLFAVPDGDADVMIRHWLSRHPTPKRVTLISSDRELQRAARGCGAKFLGSDEFLSELERRRSPRAGRGRHMPAHDDDAKPGGGISAAQAAHWLKIFGDAPIVDDEPDEASESAPPSTHPAPPPQKKSPPQRKTADRDNARGGDGRDPAELEEWLKIFGNALPENAASADELRLADLEAWLENEKRRSDGTGKKS